MGERTTFLKIADSVQNAATQLGKAYDGIKEAYNSTIADETLHEKNNNLQTLSESIQDLAGQLFAVKESLVYMEQHYAKTLDDLNTSMKKIQTINETLDNRLQNIEEAMEPASPKVASFNATDLHSSQEQLLNGIKAINKQVKSVEKKIDSKNKSKDDEIVAEIASLRLSQQQTRKELCAMEELIRLLVLNHLIDEVPAETDKSKKVEQGVTNKKEENNDWLDQVKTFLNDGNTLDAMHLCRKMADEGNIEAMSRVAKFCFDNENYSEAKFWSEKAAEQGDADSMLLLGLIYDRGLGINKDEAVAAKWFEKSAEAGNDTGMNNIAYDYQNGIGVAINYQKAIFWYEKAIDADNVVAMRKLAWMYRKGEGTSQNYPAARKLYNKAALKGDTDAMMDLATMYREGEGIEKNIAQAVDLYKRAAQKGDNCAMGWLGNFYSNGWGDASNINKSLATEWYKKSANAENSTAMNVLGNIYRRGDGVSQNYKKAVEWYIKAAEKGNSNAMTSLGYMYHVGEGVALNYDEAIRWYKLAINAEEPNTTAMYNLATMYEDGDGVQPDLVRARTLYRQAYAAGNDSAKENLERMGFTKRELVAIKVRYIIFEQLGIEYDEVKMCDTFIDDLGADSLDLVELIMAFEEEFNIEIPDEAAEKMKNVYDVCNYICQNM